MIAKIRAGHRKLKINLSRHSDFSSLYQVFVENSYIPSRFSVRRIVSLFLVKAF